MDEQNPNARNPAVQLSIVIPMFNEEENIEATVERIAETMQEFPDGAWEMIVVNDGSLDRTWDKARELAARPGHAWLRVVGYRRNRGRGFALRKGFAAARGEWICSIDADLSYHPHHILKMVEVLREEDDVDLVLASAYMPGGGAEGVSPLRLAISKVGNRILSWFMSSGSGKIHTITCVVRAYRRYVLDNMELESDNKDIHLEILSKALMLGYRFKEIPAVMTARKQGKSKFRFRRTATSHLIFALFERPIIIFGMMGLIALLLGCGIFGYFFSLWVRGIPWNPERPMMSIMIILFIGGFQLISFGIIGMQFVNLRKEMIKTQARLRMMERESEKEAES